MSNINRCAYLNSEHVLNIIEEEVPKPKSDEILIKLSANGICGSDLHFYYEGKLGNFRVTKPYIPGHEASGTIVDTGNNVKGLLIGNRVVIEPGIPCGVCMYCKAGRYNLCKEVVFLSAPPVNGTFCDYMTIRSDCVHKVPDNLTFEQAAIVEPAAVAVHAINRAQFRNGDTAAIVGAGPIGLLTLQAFKAAGGGKAICLDIIDHRLEIAKSMGANEVINISVQNNSIAEIADVIFETAGSYRATEALFRYAKTGGRVVQVGWPEMNLVNMNIADFLDKELQYVGVSRYANAFPTAITWISDGRIDVENLITHKFRLDQISEAFRFTLDNPTKVIKTIIIN